MIISAQPMMTVSQTSVLRMELAKITQELGAMIQSQDMHVTRNLAQSLEIASQLIAMSLEIQRYAHNQLVMIR